MSHGDVERSLLLPAGGWENYFSVCPCPLVAKPGKYLNISVTQLLAAFHYLLYEALTASDCSNEQQEESSDMQSMLSSWRAARYPQLKHKLTILKGCCFSLQQNWKRLKESVVSISPDQRCVSASEEEERTMNIFRLWKQTKAMQSTPQGGCTKI